MSLQNNPQTLSEWLEWMERCHPSEIELGLERICKVADLLSIDLSASVVVTVAGTNGKGSTISYLRHIYEDAGYSVGAYTSPHFLHYNERIQFNGKSVTDQQLCDVFAAIDQARGDIPLTYFEFGTLAALSIFSQEKPDIALLEVGLGGRLDAINIVDPDISIVTTVALDHTDWLGETREEIGFEKASIFRADKPAICGDLNPPKSVAEVADNKGSTLFQATDDFFYEISSTSWRWQGKDKQGTVVSLSDLPLPLLPIQNAATVLQACQLIPLPVTEKNLLTGIAQASLTGRMQNVQHSGLNIWLDVAHNPESAELLRSKIEQMQGKVCLVLGMLSDKDCQQVVDCLSPVVDCCYMVDLNVPRGEKAETLASYLPEGQVSLCMDSISDVLEQLKKDTNAFGNVIIAGSFFTVTEALAALERE